MTDLNSPREQARRAAFDGKIRLFCLNFEATGRDPGILGPALNAAAAAGRIGVVKQIMRYRLLQPPFGWPIKSAAEKGHLEIVKLLHSASPMHPIGWKAIVGAAQKNHSRVVCYLSKYSNMDDAVIGGAEAKCWRAVEELSSTYGSQVSDASLAIAVTGNEQYLPRTLSNYEHRLLTKNVPLAATIPPKRNRV